HREAAVNFFSGGPVLFDATGQVLAEAGVKEVIVIPDLETSFGEEIGEVLFQILGHAVKAGSRVAVSRRFGLLHLRFQHLQWVRTTISGRHERYHTSQRARMLRSHAPGCNRLEKKMRREFVLRVDAARSG